LRNISTWDKKLNFDSFYNRILAIKFSTLKPEFVSIENSAFTIENVSMKSQIDTALLLVNISVYNFEYGAGCPWFPGLCVILTLWNRQIQMCSSCIVFCKILTVLTLQEMYFGVAI